MTRLLKRSTWIAFAVVVVLLAFHFVVEADLEPGVFSPQSLEYRGHKCATMPGFIVNFKCVFYKCVIQRSLCRN